MTYKNTQSKPGYPWRQSSNPTKPATKSQEPDKLDRLAQPKGSNKISTRWLDVPQGDAPRDTGGKEVEGNLERGFVHNPASPEPALRNVNRMGTQNTVQEIEGPF